MNELALSDWGMATRDGRPLAVEGSTAGWTSALHEDVCEDDSTGCPTGKMGSVNLLLARDEAALLPRPGGSKRTLPDGQSGVGAFANPVGTVMSDVTNWPGAYWFSVKEFAEPGAIPRTKKSGTAGRPKGSKPSFAVPRTWEYEQPPPWHICWGKMLNVQALDFSKHPFLSTVAAEEQFEGVGDSELTRVRSFTVDLDSQSRSLADQSENVVVRHERRFQMSRTERSQTSYFLASSRASLVHGRKFLPSADRRGRPR